MKAHGYWPPSAIGIDPTDGYDEDNPLPVYDPGSGTFQPGAPAPSVVIVYADEPPADAEPGTIYLSRRGVFIDKNGDPL